MVDSNIDYWKERWVTEKTGWHQNKVDKFLLKYYQLITGKPLPSGELNKESSEFKENSLKTWYIPLCGKTKDIPFLLSLGYKVFAVEGVRKAIDDLNSENSLGLELDEEKSVFVGAEGRLKIYFGDLFKCPFEEFMPFHHVWDRGSLIALEYPCRESYKMMMQRALKGNDSFTYLLEAVIYNKEKFGGPPRSVDEEDMDHLYRDWTNAELLEKVEFPENARIKQNPGIGDPFEVIYFITPPKNKIS